MTAEVHVNDIGTVLTITLKDGTDPVPLDGATEIKMRLSDPDEVTTQHREDRSGRWRHVARNTNV